MKIKSIELSWFRGAADPVSIEPNCESMVVYGDNGSGKSSFVDAVEFVLNNGAIEHLRTEYSGSRQENAIPNTHKPAARKTALRFRFRDDSELKVDFRPNGSSTRSGAESIDMGAWEYRQTVLRQDEVAAFIHDTKGKKYSALLPLFGLHGMEVAAENLRKAARGVEGEAKLTEKKAVIRHVESQCQEAFGTRNPDRIVKEIEKLYAQHFGHVPDTDDLLSLCIELDAGIDDQIRGYSIENQKHFCLREVAKSSLQSNIEAVRSCSVDLVAAALDPQINVKLEILGRAGSFVDNLEDTQVVDCPACGQTVAVEAFREHIRMESERLQEISNIYALYKAAVGVVCNALDSLKSNLDKPVLEDWRTGLSDARIVEGLRYLSEMDSNAIRESCGDDELSHIESKLLPIIAAADRDSADAPPDVQKLTSDKKLLDTAKAAINAQDLEVEVARGSALVELMNSLEQGVRLELRRRSQRVIDGISKDIESMWATMHPGERIDSVRLALPPSADKAIDVVLRFHGLEQDSPRLTLSEGYRNSLGLCIFLAMAKQVVDKERPLFLDDVVVSLDRNHRGMIKDILENDFSDRQVMIFTHDREWYAELRHQLGGNNRWSFKTLLPYETPDIGIRWSHKSTTFDDARAMIGARPDSAGNDARKIMDVELPLIAERLRIRLPYLRADNNDRRTANDFLTRLVADGKRCFQRKSGSDYVVNTEALDACGKAAQLLRSWGNRASHTFDIVRPEAIQLIDACEIAIGTFKCDSCGYSVWRFNDEQSEIVQCQCGDIRWRYGKG